MTHACTVLQMVSVFPSSLFAKRSVRDPEHVILANLLPPHSVKGSKENLDHTINTNSVRNWKEASNEMPDLPLEKPVCRSGRNS